jgi:hypothetical protein
MSKRIKKGADLRTPPALTLATLAAIRRSIAKSRPVVADPSRAFIVRHVGFGGGLPTT